MIEISNVSKTYETGNKAIKDVSLTIDDGEFVFIVGRSGSGKSTLMKLLLKELEPTKGRIVVNDMDLGRMPRRYVPKYRRRLGVVFQDFRLLKDRTVFENVAFAQRVIGVPPRIIRETVPEMLRLVGLSSKYKAYPRQLSGGEQQRVAIARAMATNPRVLLCDEATSALDPNTTKSILQLLKRINREMGVTVIVITHEMAVIEAICDKVAIIDHSHIAEVGKVSDIFSGPKSEIGRQLILGEAGHPAVNFGNSGQIRIIFDGRESSEPIISNMVLACKVPVNIMHADTRDIEGKAMGQMLIQLPEDEADANRIRNYLKTTRVTFEEVR